MSTQKAHSRSEEAELVGGWLALVPGPNPSCSPFQQHLLRSSSLRVGQVGPYLYEESASASAPGMLLGPGHVLLCGHMVVTGVGVRRPQGNTGMEEVSPPWLGSWCGERNEKQRGEGRSREGTGPPQASRSVLLPLEFLHPPGLPARRPDTLRATRRHRTCHSAATRPPADGTQAPSLMPGEGCPPATVGVPRPPPRCSYITRVLPHPRAAPSSKSPHLLDTGV